MPLCSIIIQLGKKRLNISLALFLGQNFLKWTRAEAQWMCSGSQSDDIMHTRAEKDNIVI